MPTSVDLDFNYKIQKEDKRIPKNLWYLKWSIFATSKWFIYIGFKATIVVEYTSAMPVAILLHSGAPFMINNCMAIDSRIIGGDSSGDVTLYGPYGNVNSDTVVCYNIGTHPTEFKVHNYLMELMNGNSNNYQYKYYVYKINVYDYNQDRGDRDQFDGWCSEDSQH
jgi:hypothetical protein